MEEIRKLKWELAGAVAGLILVYSWVGYSYYQAKHQPPASIQETVSPKPTIQKTEQL